MRRIRTMIAAAILATVGATTVHAQGAETPLVPLPAQPQDVATPLVPPPTSTRDAATPLVPPPTSTRDVATPLVPPPAPTRDAATPLVPRPAPAHDAASPLVPPPGPTQSRIAPPAPAAAQAAPQPAPLTPKQLVRKSVGDLKRSGIGRALKDDVTALRRGPLLIHGNYCGIGNRPGRTPVDALDAACMRHDACTKTGTFPTCACDRRLRLAATAIAEDPANSPALRTMAGATAAAIAVLICK